VCLIVAGGPAAALGVKAPPGATARCKDGTYSKSTHHSGTCSYHGGVAVWLDASVSSPSIDVGSTVLLAPRTRTSGCKLGANPDRACSPGAYYAKLTKRVICSSGFHTGDVRNVSESTKHSVEAEYGMAPGSYGSSLEIDHIVPLELGGSNDIANLYPEKANAQPGYHAKDKLENKLHDLVCASKIDLRAAQRNIASNWQAAHQQVFRAPPVGN